MSKTCSSLSLEGSVEIYYSKTVLHCHGTVQFSLENVLNCHVLQTRPKDETKPLFMVFLYFHINVEQSMGVV
jgi:hypothetical protein